MSTIDVELLGLRIGDFVLLTFPGELTVRIGLNIKKAPPHKLTFVAGYTNGYIYYAPTPARPPPQPNATLKSLLSFLTMFDVRSTEQLCNVGGAQEDSDCLLAPHWQKRYEAKVAEMLSKL